MTTKAVKTGGYLTTGSLLELEFRRNEIARLVRLGHLESPFRNIYRLPGQGDGWRSKLHFQSLGAKLVVGALSSAMIHELGQPNDITPGYAEFLASRPTRKRIDNVQIHITSDFDELTTITCDDGLITTTVERTLIDIAAFHEIDKFTACFHAAIRMRLTTHARVRSAVAEDNRRRGKAALQRALESVGGELVAPSDWSHWAKQRLLDYGLPEPAMEVEMFDARGVRIGRVDFYWPEFNLVIELDGRAFHSDPKSFESDRKRDARLLGIGVSVLRFTWTQYNDDDYFERTVSDSIALRNTAS